jgi:uncharacterized protein (DUF1778 family)
MSKTSQLQIRVSPADKARLAAAAGRAGMSVSEWVLSRALLESTSRFDELLIELSAQPERASFTLAALNDWLTSLPREGLRDAIGSAPTQRLLQWHGAYVAAMVEHACTQRRVAAPEWARQVPALAEPYFASTIVALRAHLLRSSPAAFRRRTIFIDATIGDRV